MDMTRFDDEGERLRDLKSYGILDTGHEKIFDQLTFIAAHICNTPIALLSFIDSDRQWFKSHYGIKVEELPRHITACNTTITQNGIYEIQDSENGNCIYSEYMKSEGFRYYAGVPVVSKNGYNMGSLCVIDYKPRIMPPDDLKALKFISEQITEILEIRKRYRETLEKLNEIGSISYEKHGRIQDIAHGASMRSVAELSAGLIFRLRPLSLTVAKAIERMRDHPAENEVELQLQIIDESAKSIGLIMDRLEKFVSAEKEKWMKPLDVNEPVSSVLNHLEYKIKENAIKLEVSLQPDLWTIGNYSQLAEAVYAVVNNAIEAVANIQERNIEVILKEEKHFAVILVKDSGMGVAENIRPFIFQPFFTTKEFGLGMGLSLAQALLQRHKGDVKLIKNYNLTTFKIEIPLP